MILAPATMAAEKEAKEAARKCLEEIGLDPDSYRVGHTKARLSCPCLKSHSCSISPVSWFILCLIRFCQMCNCWFLFSSYKILNPSGVAKEADPKKCADIILQATGLDSELYRLGHTKVSSSVYCLLLWTFCVVLHTSNQYIAMKTCYAFCLPVFYFCWVNVFLFRCNWGNWVEECIDRSSALETSVTKCFLFSSRVINLDPLAWSDTKFWHQVRLRTAPLLKKPLKLFWTP